MNDLNNKTVYELKTICRNNSYRGFSKKNKEHLITFIVDKGYLELNVGLTDEATEQETTDQETTEQEPTEMNEETINTKIDYARLNKESIKKSLPTNIKCEITGVHNEFQCQIYNLYKKDVKDVMDNKELIVFHGTDESNLESILQNGFSLTNKTTHGNIFGNGIYFAKNLSLACRYPKVCDSRIIFVCKIYNKSIILGDAKFTIPPLIEKTNRHYDTYVNSLINPEQFVKNNEKSYNIIGYLRIDEKYRLREYINQQGIGIIFRNNTNYEIWIYFIKPQFKSELYKIDMGKDCRRINTIPLMPKNTYRLHSFIGHSFMCGFQDEDNEFINVAYFKLEKNKKEYVIKE